MDLGIRSDFFQVWGNLIGSTLVDLRESSSYGFSVCRPRQYNSICWKLALISGFFDISWLIVWVVGINIWLMSCRRQWMLTPGSASDPKCKLNISPFLTLPHLLNSLICTNNAMSMVLLLQMKGRWDCWGVVDLYLGVGEGTGGGYHSVFLVLLDFVTSSVPLFRWLEHDRCWTCFFVFVFSGLFH